MHQARLLPVQLAGSGWPSVGRAALDSLSRGRSALEQLASAGSYALRVGLVAALLLTLAVVQLRWGVGLALVGGLACAGVCAWVARRSGEDRPVWLALAVACASLAIGMGLGGRGQDPSLGPWWVRLTDVGIFAFAVGASVGHLAWPEIRRTGRRSLATLLDSATLVAAVAFWGAAGFPPLDRAFAGSAGPLARSVDLLPPVATAIVAAPQLAGARRLVAIALAAAMASLLASDFLATGGVFPAPYAGEAASFLQASGFALLCWAALTAAPSREPLNPRVMQPPFLAPGLLGLGALALATISLPRQSPMILVFAAGLATCLGLREALRLMERRRAREQLAASVHLEARLLDLHGDAGAALRPTDALRRSCELAVEVLRSSAAVAGIVEGDSLILRAGGPERAIPEGLFGRRIALGDSQSLLARVCRTGAGEACQAETTTPSADRLVWSILGAGWVLAVPIYRTEGVIGMLAIVRGSGASPFDEFDRQKAALIAAQAAGALHRIGLHDELEDQLRETTLVHRFAVQAGAARTINDVAWYLLESARSRVPFDRGSVYLADGDSPGKLTPVAHFHIRASDREGHGATSHLRAPLNWGETPIGYVELHRIGEEFTQDEFRVAETLGRHAAAVIQSLRLRQESGKLHTYRELDRLKTDLLNAVSHDLRGPLSNIKAYAATLADPGVEIPPEEQTLYLRTIEEEADRLRDLLDHLLDLSKIEAGALQLDIQPVGVGRVIKQALASAPLSPHWYETVAPDDLLVMGDGRRLRQVLHNLIENAAKYSPDGGSIRLTAAPRNGEVVISVSDEGVGIARPQWDRIFRPYQRGDAAITHRISGSGLGLAICKGIVEAHGGRIWVESEPGVGSTFSFTVPRARENLILDSSLPLGARNVP